jgi:hypothetical protein
LYDPDVVLHFTPQLSKTLPLGVIVTWRVAVVRVTFCILIEEIVALTQTVLNANIPAKIASLKYVDFKKEE